MIPRLTRVTLWALGSLLASAGSTAGAAPETAATACQEAELAPYTGPGTANLEGTVVSPKPAKGAAAGSRSHIEIFPAAPCVERWWSQPGSHILKRGIPQTNYPEDKRFAAAVRSVYTDEAGNFALYGVPAGRYFLRMPWLDERPVGYGVEVRGSYVLETLFLEPGKTLRLTLRGPNANQ